MQTTTTAAKPSLDYPREDETVTGRSYSIRIAAGDADPQDVELSIEGGPWRPCRAAAGYWWFDWTGYSEGTYSLTARLRRRDGRRLILPARQVEVRFA